MLVLVELLLGVVYSQLMEWGLHRYLLHGVGKRRNSLFSFHFHEHHRVARLNLGFDAMYERPLEAWTAAGKEWLSLLGLLLLHIPLIPVVPWFVLAAFLCGVRYYVMHRHAHLDPQWCRERLPWHYAHHMGPNQDKNWGVTTDWVDRVFGTRVIYVGTPKEEQDTRRRMANKAKKVG